MSATSTSTGPGGVTDVARLGRMLGAGIWLVFLLDAAKASFDRRDEWQGVLGLASIVVFVAVYLAGIAQVPWFHQGGRRWASLPYVGGLLACSVGIILGAEDRGLACLVFVAALSVASLPRWAAFVVVVGLFGTVEVLGRTIDGWMLHGNDFAILLATAATYSFRLAWQRQAKLRAAERDLSELAVEEERARIARDLHDILGHSLTVISVKAELAERLFEADPVRARAELGDLQRLTRDALADVRSTAQGIRGISLPGEIASARMALESAGIEPDLPTVADEVPSRWRELFAWTLREGVTNVIRHSEASRCEVELDPVHITVLDDGRGPCPDDGSGHGLEGLRQRARLAGATVTTSAGPGERGFALTVSVPA